MVYKQIPPPMVYNKGHAFLDWDPPNNAFNQDFYKKVLDPELCQTQLNYIRRNNTFLLAQFLDAGIRIPKGFLWGNIVDMGNYHQCLAISDDIVQPPVEGKYCLIGIPLFEITPENKLIETFNKKYGNAFSMILLLSSYQRNNVINIQMAMCVPKPCTTRETLNALLFNLTANFKYEDVFCRLPNDKAWVTGDIVAVSILSVIGFLSILSTAYDIWYTKIQKKDPKYINKIITSFSIYKNTRDVLTFKTTSNSLLCLDGIRAISMLWVIVGHSYSSQVSYSINVQDFFKWMSSLEAIWIMAAPICVDTFFLLSGLLIVYVTAAKYNYMQLLKNLHLFYLNRLLRMFPLLALTVLLEATLFNHVADGPFWNKYAENIHKCKTYWWSTLLYIQNYVNPENLCLTATWYLAIDVQLHILSPLLLFWVLGRQRKVAWAALTCVWLASLTAATIYNFIKEFPSSPLMPSRLLENVYYMTYYYMNTLTRANVFIIGMMLGYLLYIWKGHQLKISKVLNMFLWIISLSICALIIYCIHPTLQIDYENQILDSIINSFMRPLWALALSWIIFACVKGYGGPINWLFCWSLWKLPARISFSLYLLHMPFIEIINATTIFPLYFDDRAIIFKYMGILFLTMMVGFIATVLIEQPFNNLIKLVLEPAARKSAKSQEVLKPANTGDGLIFESGPNKEK
nr:nose resistant to fluoxetine protein 6-like [Danaus plexippus plexippus]